MTGNSSHFLQLLGVAVLIGGFPDGQALSNLKSQMTLTSSGTITHVAWTQLSQTTDGRYGYVHYHCILTPLYQNVVWWRGTLGSVARIRKVDIEFSGFKLSNATPLKNSDGFELWASNDTTAPPSGLKFYEDTDAGYPGLIQNITCDVTSKSITIYLMTSDLTARLDLCEVDVYGCFMFHYGNQCENICYCKYGCDAETGACDQPGECQAGWEGLRCDQVCTGTTFGESCRQVCHCKDSGCDPVNGLCVSPGCDAGYQGNSCIQVCNTTSFGEDCASACHCNVPGCSPVIGVCATPGCAAGYKGNTCSTQCGVRTFDEDCAFTCHCASAGCDRFQGTCDDPDAGCTDGYTGSSCSQAWASLSDTCGTGTHPAVCDDPTTTSCIKGTTPGTMVCRCSHGLFDSNGYSTAGGICTPMSNLEVTEVKSSGAVCSSSVTITWTPPSDSSQISSYSVVWRVSGSADVTGSFYAGKLESATITGLTPGTSYVFTVKSTETGSRASPQEVESDSHVIIATCTSTTPWIAAISSSALLIVLLAISNAFLWNRSRGTCKHKEESNYATPERVYTNTDMNLYTLTHEDSQQAARTGTGDEGYSNIDVYDTAS